MFTTGYLTRTGGTVNGAYRLVIPNREIREVFIIQIQEWFKQTVMKDAKPVQEFFKICFLRIIVIFIDFSGNYLCF